MKSLKRGPLVFALPGRHQARTLIRMAALASLAVPSFAAVSVNSPLPVTHQVWIQPILTKHSNGTTAMYLGNATSESYIKGQINAIWAQSGVQISWLEPVVYQNNFAYNGAPANYTTTTRPIGDLNTILNNAGTPPKNPNGTIINAFFVEIVPGFNQLGDSYANGLAYVDSNGLTMHVGRDLVTWTGGRDVIASVLGHEIGHNLGLNHVGGSNNLMSSGSSTGYLLGSQTTTVFTNNSGTDGYDFLAPIPQPSQYEQWAELHELEGGPEDDDDHDDLSNVIEFVTDLDPNSADALPAPVWTPAGLVWTLPKSSGAVADGLTMTVEVSEQFNQWAPAGSGASTVLANNNSQLSVRLNSGLPGCFMRLSVEVPQLIGANAAGFSPADLLDAGPEPAISACSHGGCGCRSLPSPP